MKPCFPVILDISRWWSKVTFGLRIFIKNTSAWARRLWLQSEQNGVTQLESKISSLEDRVLNSNRTVEEKTRGRRTISKVALTSKPRPRAPGFLMSTTDVLMSARLSTSASISTTSKAPSNGTNFVWSWTLPCLLLVKHVGGKFYCGSKSSVMAYSSFLR